MIGLYCLDVVTPCNYWSNIFTLRPFHMVISVGIAFMKVALIVLFFMHLRSLGDRTVFLVLGGMLLPLILIGITAIDYSPA